MKKVLQRVFVLLTVCSMSLSMLQLTAWAEEGGVPEPSPSHTTLSCESCLGTGSTAGEPSLCPTCGGNPDLDATISCPSCKGTGTTQRWETCPVCDGATGLGETCEGGCMAGNLIQSLPCTTCNGTKEVPDPNGGCSTCLGAGTVPTTVGCTACGGTGNAPCPQDGQSFDTATLTALSTEGLGTMTHSCSLCKASYTQPLDAAQTAAAVQAGLTVSLRAKSPLSANAANRSGGVEYTLTIENAHPVALKGLQVTLSLAPAITGVQASTSGMSNKSFDAQSHTYSFTLDLKAKAPTATRPTTAKIPLRATAARARAGDVLPATVAVSLSSWQLASATASVDITHTDGVYLAGYNLGQHHGSGSASPYTTTAAKKSSSVLSDYDTALFSFQSGPFAGVTTAVDANGLVRNEGTGRLWQCVGFLPIQGTAFNGELSFLEGHVYSTTAGDGFADATSLSQVQELIQQGNGVLYGQQAQGMEQTLLELLHSDYSGLDGGYLTFVTVWYLPSLAELSKGSYAPIPPLPPVDYQPTSATVTAALVPGSVSTQVENRHRFFDATIQIQLGQGGGKILNIDLQEALADAAQAISALHHNQLQPGDTIRYHLTLQNTSGKSYAYVPGSAAIGTVPAPGEGEGLPTGFEGYPIHQEGTYSHIPHRVLNAPVQALLDTLDTPPAAGEQLSDKTLGRALQALGYGQPEQTSEQVAQTCLGSYYLDYLNRYARSGGSPIQSFADLTAQEFALLTNAVSDSHAPESCPQVTQALYYFYYGRSYLFDGEGLYQRMAENGQSGSYAEELIKTLLSTGRADLTTQLAGESTNNGFQMTCFRYGLQFRLSRPSNSVLPVTPAPSTTPTVTPTPSATPEPTPSTQPSPPPAESPEPSPVQPPETPTPTPMQPPTIPEPDIPPEDIPKTGDSTPFWCLFTLLSGGGAATAAFLNRKGRKHRKQP